MYRPFVKSGVCFATCALMAAGADAGVIRVSAANFHPTAGLITFSASATNPTYTPADYGAVTGPTVTTGGYFSGQSLSASPGVDCPGAAATACVIGDPSGPLSLDPTAPNVFVTSDGSNPTSPVLSGTPTFNGPIAVLFSTDQYGVGFDAGYFNAIASTGITAFDRQGNLLGTVSNTGLGIEFLGLVTDNGVAEIAGVFLDLVGNEPAGFAIDNLRFAQVGEVSPDVPEPSSWAMLLVGFGAVGGVLRARRRVQIRFA